MPDWFDDGANRAESIVSAFATNPRQPLYFKEGLNLSLQIPNDDVMMNIELNGESFRVPNFPYYLDGQTDVKYDTPENFYIELGLISKCFFFHNI